MKSRPDAATALASWRSPHFIGTFDAFINRFITKPLYVQQYGQTPRFTDSWQGVQRGSFRVPDMDKMPNLELDWFDLDWMLRATLNRDWIPLRYRGMLAPLIAARRDELDARATSVCRALVASGTLNCAASRALAAGYLGGKTPPNASEPCSRPASAK